jgi:hypothetical protein
MVASVASAHTPPVSQWLLRTYTGRRERLFEPAAAPGAAAAAPALGRPREPRLLASAAQRTQSGLPGGAGPAGIAYVALQTRCHDANAGLRISWHAGKAAAWKLLLRAIVKWRATLAVHEAWSSLLSLCGQACMCAQTKATAEQLPALRLAVRAQHAELHMRSRAPSLLLQDCYLAVIPTRLRPATALRRLRIADEGAGLLITSADLDTLSALRSLTFLSLTQACSCTQYWIG